MEWEEFKKIVKELRKISDMLSSKLGTRVWCEFNLHISDDLVLEINPYCPNLKTGVIEMVRDLMSGKWVHEINIKEKLNGRK